MLEERCPLTRGAQLLPLSLGQGPAEGQGSVLPSSRNPLAHLKPRSFSRKDSGAWGTGLAHRPAAAGHRDLCSAQHLPSRASV